MTTWATRILLLLGIAYGWWLVMVLHRAAASGAELDQGPETGPAIRETQLQEETSVVEGPGVDVWQRTRAAAAARRGAAAAAAATATEQGQHLRRRGVNAGVAAAAPRRRTPAEFDSSVWGPASPGAGPTTIASLRLWARALREPQPFPQYTFGATHLLLLRALEPHVTAVADVPVGAAYPHQSLFLGVVTNCSCVGAQRAAAGAAARGHCNSPLGLPNVFNVFRRYYYEFRCAKAGADGQALTRLATTVPDRDDHIFEWCAASCAMNLGTSLRLL